LDFVKGADFIVTQRDARMAAKSLTKAQASDANDTPSSEKHILIPDPSFLPLILPLILPIHPKPKPIANLRFQN
jgi:hypothetical protein